MLLKRIVCNVEPECKQDFFIAQANWQKISQAEGFIAQIGGWNINNNKQACIMAFWQDKNHLDIFMQSIHDEIVAANKQENSYSSIKIDYFESAISHYELLPLINQAGFLETKEIAAKQIELKAPDLVFKSSDSSKYLLTRFWKNLAAYKLAKAIKTDKQGLVFIDAWTVLK